MSRFLRKLASALGLLLAVSPVFAVIGAAALPDAAAHWALWPAAAVLLAELMGLLKGRRRAVCGVMGLAGFVAAVALWGPGGGWPLLALPSATLYWLVLLTAARPPFDEWAPGAWLAGVAVHVAGFIAVRLLSLNEIVPVLRALAFLYVPVFLLSVNRQSLQASASARGGSVPPRRIRSGNRRLVLGVSAAALVVANLRTLRDAFYDAGNALLRAFAAFLMWLSGLFVSEIPATGGEQGGGDMEMLMEEVAETATIWMILEKILIALAIAAAVVLAVVALRKLWQMAKKLIKRLAERMRGLMTQLSEGVQEKTESILDWEEVRDAALQRVRRIRRLLARPPRWQDMDNRLRVRWAYGQTVRAGDAPSRTARESLRSRTDGERMADIYDAARYSEQPVTDEDAVFMREAVKRNG